MATILHLYGYTGPGTTWQNEPNQQTNDRLHLSRCLESSTWVCLVTGVVRSCVAVSPRPGCCWTCDGCSSVALPVAPAGLPRYLCSSSNLHDPASVLGIVPQGAGYLEQLETAPIYWLLSFQWKWSLVQTAECNNLIL